VFAKAREKARQTACISNEKQIGLALMQYVQDYDDVFMSHKQTGSSYSWKQVLDPYIKSTGVWVCPSRNNPASDGNGYLVSYGPNTMCSPGGQTCTNVPTIGVIGYYMAGTTMSKITVPTTTIAVTEVSSSPIEFQIFQTSATAYVIWSGHTTMGNYLFVDGHTKALRPEQTISTTMGGAGSVDMWDRNGADFTGFACSGTGAPCPITTAMAAFPN